MRANTAGTIFKIVAVIALLGSIGGFFLDYVTGITGFEIFRATMADGAWTRTKIPQFARFSLKTSREAL